MDAKAALAAKFEQLKARRSEARAQNQEDVADEDRKAKLPANYESRKRQADWELKDAEARKAAELAGVDYDRQKSLEVSAEEYDRREHKKKKSNPDTGFSDFAAASFRQYERCIKDLKPDAVGAGAAGAAGPLVPHPLAYGQDGKVSKDGLDRLVADVKKKEATRQEFSRRRHFNADADISHINERNMVFNKKLERFYGKHTQEIKDSLERGTAI